MTRREGGEGEDRRGGRGVGGNTFSEFTISYRFCETSGSKIQSSTPNVGTTLLSKLLQFDIRKEDEEDSDKVIRTSFVVCHEVVVWHLR